MGLYDRIKAKVLTEYKADTSEHKRAMRGLSKEEKKRHQALIDQLDEQNRKLEGQLETWGKVATAVGGVGVAAKVLSDGFDTLTKNTRLAAATVGADVDGLTRATNGLVNETRLLEFASKAMNGTFQLSQNQMEGALRGALALRKTLGKELPEALDIVQKAVVEGSVEPLKELGIVVKDVENDTKEGLNAALRALSDEATKAGKDLGLAGDDMLRAGVSMENSADSFSESMGRIAAAIAPVAAAMAGLLEMVISTSDALAGVSARDYSTSLLQDARRSIREQEEALRRAEKLYGGVGIRADMERGGLSREEAEAKLRSTRAHMHRLGAEHIIGNAGEGFGGILDSFTGASGSLGSLVTFEADPKKKKKKRRKGELTKAEKALERAMQSAIASAAQDDIERLLAETQASNDNRNARYADMVSNTRAEFGAVDGAAAMQQAQQLLEEVRLVEQTNILAGIFGTPAEINATAEALNALTTGFDGLSSAFGAGVDALITGSSSFAEAFKSAIGESLRAMAVDMSIRAVKHTAFAAASLAFLDGRGAAKHAAAAGMFGAGALAAGLGARALGAGQAPSVGGTPSTAGAAGVGSASVSSAQDKGSTTVYLLGDDHGSWSVRDRESRIRESLRRGGMSIDGDFSIAG